MRCVPGAVIPSSPMSPRRFQNGYTLCEGERRRSERRDVCECISALIQERERERERECVCVFVKERCFVCVYIFIYTFVNVNVCVYIIHESILTRRFSKLFLASISWAWGASSSWANLEMDSRSFARDRGQWDMDENTHVHQAWLSSIMRLL